MNSATGYHSPLWADAFQCEGVVDTHTDHIDRRIAADTAAARAVWERGCVAFEAAQAAAGVSGWCPHLAGVHGPGGYLVPVFDFGADAPRKSAERSALVFALAFEEAERAAAEKARAAAAYEKVAFESPFACLRGVL